MASPTPPPGDLPGQDPSQPWTPPPAPGGRPPVRDARSRRPATGRPTPRRPVAPTSRGHRGRGHRRRRLLAVHLRVVVGGLRRAHRDLARRAGEPLVLGPA